MIATNTVWIRFLDGTEVIRHHDTNIKTRHPDGTIIYNTGGFDTRSTKERLNQKHFPEEKNIPPITQKNYFWYIGSELFNESKAFEPKDLKDDTSDI